MGHISCEEQRKCHSKPWNQRDRKRLEHASPQERIDRIWKEFSNYQPHRTLTIINIDPPSSPIAIGQSNKLLYEDYARTTAECRRKVGKIVKECKRVNMRYRDSSWDLEWDLRHERGHCLNSLGQQEFDLSPTALLGSEDKVPKAVKRVHEIFVNSTFMEDINVGDIKQGNLSDCWFLAGLIALANVPACLKRTCVAYNTAVGVYGFVFYRDGEWIHTIIDDKLYVKSPYWDSPSTQRDLLEQVECENAEKLYRETYQTGSRALFFAQCKDQKETWVPLIEKAYAKAHGDYSSLAGGWMGEALEDLTGGVTTELCTSDILDTDEFWHRELSRVNDHFFFGASTGHLENGSGERDGIEETHAYVILDARTLKNGQRLVKLRNPWGDTRKGIWEGPWSDGSKEWTREIQEEVGHKFGSDSVFWISYQDLLRKFSHIDRTRLFQDHDWRCCQRWMAVGVPLKAQYHERFRIKVTQSSPLIIVISQLDDRYFKGLQGQYSFQLDFRLHSQDSPDADSYIARSHGNYLMTRSVSVEIPTLLPGTYIVYVKVTARRDHTAQLVEDVVRRECLERTENDKLLQVGLAHDVAQKKASPLLNRAAKLHQDTLSKRASENRQKERRRLWLKRHAKREATKKQKEKDVKKRRSHDRETASGTPVGRIQRQTEAGAWRKNDATPTKIECKIDSGGTSHESVLSNSKSGSDCHTALDRLTSDDERKPTGTDASVSRNPSHLRRSKLPWTRKHVSSSASTSSFQPIDPGYKRVPVKGSTSRNRSGAEGRLSYSSDDESSDSPVEDWEALYSSDDMTQQPYDNLIGDSTGISLHLSSARHIRDLRAESSDGELYDSEQAATPTPWDATCTISARVYSKDEDLLLWTVENGILLEEVRMKRPR
ncbi:hypothetical protein FALBO_16796 [Fusarium albosuccineum]|uniref:Calpain catalytic domain-containing protein n=1 Tax=Fusarium albosuccineum TaxID=1237068 RepID=A0A8H4NXP4_9HYPO|nr:hypothetical protein FALBO_16796 [Fusarium albosuccineum]